VLVIFHGGPEGQSQPVFIPLVQFVATELKMAVLVPNVRGSEGYGKAWLHADDGPKRLSVITDIEDCAKYLRTAWARNGVPPKLAPTARCWLISMSSESSDGSPVGDTALRTSMFAVAELALPALFDTRTQNALDTRRFGVL